MSSASKNGTGISVSGGGGDDNDSQVSIYNRLVAAIRAGNMENLREIILSLHDQEDRRSVTENDIDRALWDAAEVGFVDGCRLLWTRLSPNTKQKYFAATNRSARSLLHEAMTYGHLQVIRFFFEECNFNINQKDQYGETPLSYVRDNEEMCLLLLDAGANVNLGGIYGPIFHAVDNNNTQVVRLLLQRGANPNINRRPCNEEGDDHRRHFRRNTDLAIQKGNIEILSLLLQHGAFVDAYNNNKSLFYLLRNQHENREIKLSITRLLVEHAKDDLDTAAFMQASFEFAIKQMDNDGCQIFIQAGMNPSSRWVWACAIQEGNEPVCRLLVQYGADPFSEDENEDEEHAASPFLAAARQSDTRIFEYFLDLWSERFASNGGKNGDGDYPLHVICCDPHVSLQAIERVVDRQVDTVSKVDGEQGLLPFHFAAMWDSSLDVIYYLLKHCPDALHHVGNAAAVPAVLGATAANAFTNNDNDDDDDAQQDQAGSAAAACGPPIKKKAKISH